MRAMGWNQVLYAWEFVFKFHEIDLGTKGKAKAGF